MSLSSHVSLLVLQLLDLPQVIELYRSHPTVPLRRALATFHPLEVISYLYPVNEKWNWFLVASHISLTLPFLQRWESRFGNLSPFWFRLCMNRSLTLEMIKKYHHQWKGHSWYGKTAWWELLSDRITDPEALELADLNWNILSNKFPVTEELLQRYESKWNWKELSDNHNLTPQLIEQYWDRLDPVRLCDNISLTSALIDRLHERLLQHELEGWTREKLMKHCWCNLSSNSTLPLDTIEKYQDWIDWTELSEHIDPTLELIQQYESRWDWSALSHNMFLTSPIILHYLDRLDHTALAKDVTSELLEQLIPFWLEKEDREKLMERVSKNWSLTPALIRQYCDHLDFVNLSELPVVADEELIEQFLPRWNWSRLTYTVFRYRWELIVDHPEWPWRWT